MNNIFGFRFLVIQIFGVVLLCSCATTSKPLDVAAASELPVEVAIGKLSPHAPRLMVTLRLENGAKFDCIVDTGSSRTVLPDSLQGQLGKRLFQHEMVTLDGDVQTAGIYAAPKIYLGDAQLVTGDRICTWSHPVGVLAMDCLRHYCIQLDFQTGKIRFLKSGDTYTAGLGKAFPLTNLDYVHIHQSGFFQAKASAILIDTGHPLDGMISPRLFKQAVREQKAVPISVMNSPKFNGKNLELARFPTFVWDGQTYSNLIIQAGNQQIIGLRFLVRDRVTFDFPKRTMYLKYIGEENVRE